MLELFSPLFPFWTHVISFGIGMFIGFFIRGLYGSGKVDVNLLDVFIRYSVAFLWVGSMSKAVFFGGAYPDAIFHLIFGAVFGVTNQSGGDMVLQVLKSYFNKKK